MNIRQRIANFLSPTQKNAMGSELAHDFLRYGSRNVTMPDWSQLMMSDRDKYSGYMYAAITRRANKVAWLATYNLQTKANDATTKDAKTKKSDLTHPYLALIDESPTFANDAFWREIQTFVDLKGEYFLLAVRGSLETKIGEVKEFKLLNPYDITAVYDANDLEVIGYTESRGSMFREIPKDMIIPIKTLNPFDRKKPFALADAAKDAQFTLKETSEQMRNTARRNRKYPGVVHMGNGEVTLDPEAVANFKDRMRGAGSGRSSDEPMFTSGTASTLAWNDMQVDLRKSAVDVVNEIELNALIAVTGVSKTKLGIEQSGVTRDTAAIQDDLFVTDQGMTALQLIIDALNQDYKTRYPDEYKKTGYLLYIDSPLKEDKEAELTDVTNRTNTFDLYEALINKGYDEQTAADYASGDMPLVDIGAPTNPPKIVAPVTPPTTTVVADPVLDKPISTKASHEHTHDLLPAVRNQLDQGSQAVVGQQEASLKNAVINVEHQVIAAVLNKVTKNAFDSQSDLIDEQARKDAENQLELALATFYGIVIPLNAGSVMSRRANEFGLFASFKIDPEINSYIRITATRAADSHINTVLQDILSTVQTTLERVVQGELKKITPTAGQSSEEVLALARAKALEGVGQDQIVAAIRKEYSTTISKVRATTIARTESRRAYNRAQFEADRQFLAQNGLTDRAYKKWVTRSGNPCPFCISKSEEAPIPFTNNFAVVGDVLKATYDKADGTPSVRQMKVGFEDVGSGNLHPNCQCTYQLIIE